MMKFYIILSALVFVFCVDATINVWVDNTMNTLTVQNDGGGHSYVSYIPQFSVLKWKMTEGSAYWNSESVHNCSFALRANTNSPGSATLDWVYASPQMNC